MPSIAGFWSYAHTDDQNDEGRILALAQRLQAEYELLTAEKLELFIDESALFWGDDWREKIAEALERVTFFIPIITPTYFQRPECRKELMRFAREAKQHQAEKLILPIYYVEVPELEGDVEPADEVMAAVKPLQRVDLRTLRLRNRDRAAYRRLVNRLANRLLDIARETETGDGTQPPPETLYRVTGAPSGAPSDQGEVPPEDSNQDSQNEEFLLEEMAKGENALRNIQEPLEAIGADITELGSLMRQSTGELEEADSAGKPGFASRLSISRRLAQRLEEPARQMEGHAKKYVSFLWEIDPFVNRLLDWAMEMGSDEEEVEKDDFLTTVRDLAKTTMESSNSTAELLGTLEESANFSRDLRQPLRIYQTSLRNIIDAQAVMEQWARRAEEIQESKREGPESEEG